MNPENPGNGPDSSSNILFKRKRGRPRKDQNQNITRIANIISMRNQIQGHGDNSPATPGFARANGNHSHQENLVDHETNDMVGQPVAGVVEAMFDEGYLLSVKIGNSETSLRGIVFKPGHYIPVSTENDVAPHIEMINRNAVPIPPGFHTPVHGSYRRGRGRGRSRNESRLASFSANGSSQLQMVPAQPSAGDRGTLEPVLLQPADVSNGVSPTTEARTIVVNQTEISQMEIDNGSSSTVKLAGGVKEELVSKNRNESAQQSGGFSPEQMQDLSPPLSVEPLQSIHSDFYKQSSSVSQNFREARAGKMTELLLAVQENVIDKQATDVHHHNIEHQQN